MRRRLRQRTLGSGSQHSSGGSKPSHLLNAVHSVNSLTPMSVCHRVHGQVADVPRVERDVTPCKVGGARPYNKKTPQEGRPIPR